MSSINIAVIGGGNGALTIAGDMSLAGFSVRLWSAFPDELDTIYETKAINLKGIGREGVANIDIVTKDLGEALDGADVICSPSPAYAQEDLAKKIGPHLKDGQALFLSPGSLGSYLTGKILRANGWCTDITIAEPGTLPYLTRKISLDEVLISGHAVKLPVGVFPADKTENTIKTLKKLFPAIHPVENVLSVTLLNVGPIIHSVLILLNTGPIESLETWDIHNEGTTKSVKKLILAHDQERVAIRKALGFKSHHYPFSDHYDENSENIWMYGRKAHVDLVESGSWRESLDFRHRYVQEDVKCNLSLFSSIGNLCNVNTPITNALLELIGAIVDEDLLETGRTLKLLGLSGKSIDEIFQILEEGF